MPHLEAILNGAVEAANEAAAYISQAFHRDFSIEHKGVVDLVTEVDIASERLIRKILQNKFPEIRFHGEEDGGDDWKNGEVWIVDPIDGTTNFANRLPHFCVSIALCRDGSPELGVIINPITRDLYTATRGSGSFLNQKPLSVSKISDINQALAVTGFPYDRRERLDEILRRLRVMLMHTQCVRRFGSAALDLCYIARGIYSIYWETNLKPWDVAAGKLIVEEAGGCVSKINGEPMLLDSLELLATNSILHPQAIELLRQADTL